MYEFNATRKLNVFSWIQSTTFASFMLARAVGGASEGNVQLAMFVVIPLIFFFLPILHFFSAILSDVTTPENRAKALSHVGIAFAICFCIGPPIGAYFASRPTPLFFRGRELDMNIYATPAILTLILLILETIFLVVALPETRGKSIKSEKELDNKSTSSNTRRKADPSTRLSLLSKLRQFHFWFLGVFSGI
jgi:hypothetical protein